MRFVPLSSHLVLTLLAAALFTGPAMADPSRTPIPESLRGAPGTDPFVRLLQWGETSPAAITRAEWNAWNIPPRELSSTGVPDGSWSDVPLFTPPGLLTACGVHDPVRDRLIVFGGSDGAFQNGTWILDLRPEIGWRQVFPAGALPSPRRLAKAVYDPVRDRVLLFGGFDGAFYADVWALHLSGPLQWELLATSGPTPAARAGHAMIYEPTGDRIIVFGGYDGVSAPAQRRQDVWQLALSGTPTWSEILPTGPSPGPRSSHTAVLDPVRNRMLVFGGSTPAFLNDVWALDLGSSPAWTLLPTASPPAAREEHSAVYDASGDRLVVFGGYDNTFYYGDARALPLSGPATWSAMPVGGGVRWGHVAVVQPSTKSMVVFGGYGLDYLRDTRALDLQTESWTGLDAIQPRHTAAEAYDSGRQRMILFGGSDDAYRNDVFVLDLVLTPQWRKLVVDGTPPSPRRLAAAAYDPLRARVLVFGGYDGTFYSDLWALSTAGTPTWSPVPTSGPAPAARAGHGLVYDPSGDRLVLFGGFDGVSPTQLRRNDVWTLDLSTPGAAWTALTPAGSPPSPRSSFTCVYDAAGDRALIFGGTTPAYMGDTWALSLGSSPTWSLLAAFGPAPREEHSAIHDGTRGAMVVFGGYDESFYFADTWRFSYATSTWQPLAPFGFGPAARWGHAAVYDPLYDRMALAGGRGFATFSDTWLLTWDRPTPVQLALVEATAGPASVQLTWQSADRSGGIEAFVERSDTGGPWIEVGVVVNDGNGRMRFEDPAVAPGTRYGYRLRVVEHGLVSYHGSVEVDVPAAAFAILATRPTARGLVLRFSVPAPTRAAIDVVDVAGRIIAQSESEVGSAGAHDREIAFASATPRGVCFIRLRTAQGDRVRKWVAVH